MTKKIRDLKIGDRFKFNEWCTWEQVESQPHPADSDRPDLLWVFNTVGGRQYQSPDNLVIVQPIDYSLSAEDTAFPTYRIIFMTDNLIPAAQTFNCTHGRRGVFLLRLEQNV